MTDSTQHTVLLVDDHPLYLDAISQILREVMGDVKVIHATTAKAAIDALESLPDPDLIFVDYKLPDDNGINLVRQFNDRMLASPIVVVSGIDDIAIVADAMALGVSGFIHKGSSKNAFRECLDTIEQGDNYLAPELKVNLAQYRQTFLKEKQRILADITARRREILLFIAEGYANGEIAKSLGVSEATVKAHVSTLMTTLDADNRYHCVAEAKRWGIID